MSRRTHWWDGILARSLMSVVGIALLMGGASSLLMGQLAGARSYDQALVRLGALLDTVENAAARACATNDVQLADEVVRGLLRNGDVRRAAIRVGANQLAHGENPVAKAGAGDTARQPPPPVRRALHAPGRPETAIGEIEIDADWENIDARMRGDRRLTSLLLVAQIALVIAAAAAMMLFLVVRPIKATSDRLHRLAPASGERLDVPEGHERTEIGRLVGDINQLTGQLVATLDEERALRERREIDERKYRDLFDNAGSGIFVADRDGRLASFNRAFVELVWPHPRAEEGRDLFADSGWREPGALLELIHAALDTHGAGSREDDFLLVDRRGEERWLHVVLVPLGDGSVQGTVTDVTQRKLEELSAHRLAVTDSLTGFANREGLHRALAVLDPGAPPFALVMIDLDGFKRINDAMGFPVGDRLLIAVAGRLREMLAAGDSAARVGGDVFVLTLVDARERATIAARMGEIVARLARPYEIEIGGNVSQVEIGASVGVALFPADGIEVQQLLRGAEIALGSAREDGSGWRFFDPALQAAMEYRRRLEDDLRAAVASRDLQLYFQPIVDLRRGVPVGAEALLRWTHIQRGAVSPEVFIPLAEELDLIAGIGLNVLELACQEVAIWRRAGLDYYVSVNVSAHQIPDELPPEAVLAALRRHGLPPEAVVIEITEGVLMSDVTVAQRWIESLRAAGLRIYLDDFGTGYSSLSYLKRFPMDTVKIDKSFVHDMRAGNSERALVEAIVAMAASLGLKVVAEGIEDEVQFALLRELGCGYGQGFLFSRPVPAADFLATALRIASGAAGQPA